jgi:hypothetical protein
MNSGVMAPRRAPSESWMVFLIGAVQFINIWDFVMVMPLGPDFARTLGIPPRGSGSSAAPTPPPRPWPGCSAPPSSTGSIAVRRWRWR